MNSLSTSSKKEEGSPKKTTLCEECEIENSTVICNDCDQQLCKNCDVKIHNKGSRLKHNRSPIATVQINEKLIEDKGKEEIAKKLDSQKPESKEEIKIEKKNASFPLHDHSNSVIYIQKPSYIHEKQFSSPFISPSGRQNSLLIELPDFYIDIPENQ